MYLFLTRSLHLKMRKEQPKKRTIGLKWFIQKQILLMAYFYKILCKATSIYMMLFMVFLLFTRVHRVKVFLGLMEVRQMQIAWKDKMNPFEMISNGLEIFYNKTEIERFLFSPFFTLKCEFYMMRSIHFKWPKIYLFVHWTSNNTLLFTCIFISYVTDQSWGG